MKDIICVILACDIKKLLYDETANYLIKSENDCYIISDFPILYKGKMNDIKKYIAYDYNLLNEKNKIQYKDFKRKFILVDSNKYKLDTKIYQLKKRKNYFPKQN